MTALVAILTLAVLAAAYLAVRSAPPAAPPHGRRVMWVALLLLAQLGALYGFVAIWGATRWGIATASPPGLALLTQVLRAGLLVLALRAWFGLVRGELASRGSRILVALAVLALGWSGGGLPILAAIVLGFALQRHRWLEQMSGWRRAVGFVLTCVLLVVLSFVPFPTAAGGASEIRFAIGSSPWPPPLLLGKPAATTELALIRPLDRLVQAIVDLLRVQLLVAATKLLFLPVRLAGMSLKRRFTINFFLVRSIPAVLSALLIFGLAYLGFGAYRMSKVRGAFAQTLARAGTAAAALAGDPSTQVPGPAARFRLAQALTWLGEDGARAQAALRDSGRVRAMTAGCPPALAADSLAERYGLESRGLVAAGDTLYLMARQAAGARAAEVYMPLDSAYLCRIMDPIGGDLRVTVLQAAYVSGQAVSFHEDSLWTTSCVTVRALDPDTTEGRRARRWYLARSYLPVGEWGGTARGSRRGAVEFYLETTAWGLISSLGGSLGGLASNFMTLAIALVAIFGISMLESFAVRSGRSIVQAVLDEMTLLRQAAERFGAGDLDYRLPAQGKDEFSVVAASFNDMAASLKRQREELVAKERLEEDLKLAREIQQRFLPQSAPGLAGLDVAGVSLPSREVGGDLFYWFAHDDGSLGFTLGDVSGKSVPAALLMSNVLSALRAQAILRAEVAESLAGTNRLIIDQIEPGRFVTLFYGEADPLRGELRYASAGHNPPLLVRAGGAHEWLRAGGVPLGVLPEAEYATTRVGFALGDTLVVYSDGVTEAEGPGGAPGEPELFGEERLAAAVGAPGARSAREVLDAVLRAVEAFVGGRPQADDITVLVVRRV